MDEKNIKRGAIAAVAITATLLAGTALSSYLVKDKLTKLQSNPDKDSQLVLTSLSHNAGFLNSSGIAFLKVQNKCYPDMNAEVKVEYVFHHLPLPWAPLRADIKIYPAGEMAGMLDSVAGGKFMLSGNSSLTPLGAYKLKLDIPSVASRNAGEVLDIPVNTLNVTYSNPAVRMEWHLPTMEYRGHSSAVTVKDANLDFNVSDYHKGLGSLSFNINQIASNDMLMDGFSVVSRMEESGKTLNYVTSASASKVQAAGKNFKDMAVEFKLNGIDAESYYFLSGLMQKTCGVQQLTMAESQQATDAVNKILVKGGTFNLSKLSVDSAEGKFDASFEIALSEHAPSEKQISLASHLSAKGNAELSGNLLPANQQQMLLSLGVSVLKDKKLMSSFNFSNGKLTLNGNPPNQEYSAKIQEGLVLLDVAVNKLISSKLGFGTDPLANQTLEEAAPDQATTEFEAAPEAEAAPAAEATPAEVAPEAAMGQ